MVTFPARKIIDIRIGEVNKGIDAKILYHNKDFKENLSNWEMATFHIRFNLYDVERKVYISKEKTFDESRAIIFSAKDLRKVKIETIADSVVPSSFDYNNIWEYKVW